MLNYLAQAKADRVIADTIDRAFIYFCNYHKNQISPENFNLLDDFKHQLKKTFLLNEEAAKK